MKQAVQPTAGGDPIVVEAPAPLCAASRLLVATSATLISAGTERSVTHLAQSNLIRKAQARPDLVRQVVAKARVDGVRSTVAAIRSKLAEDVSLGYSGAGTVLEVGTATSGFQVGDRVATAGGGFASHAEIQSVPWVLAAKLPETVSFEAASFAAVASVGLHGLRLAEINVGDKVLIVGLGLIGQLTARIAVASGCDVFGIDLDDRMINLAKSAGLTAAIEQGDETTEAIRAWSRGRGADSIIISAGAPKDSSIVQAVPDRCRDRATVVAVGDIGLDLDRNAFYHKELQLRVARSYGPGRYERSYEEWGVDYPVGHIRWSEGRNLEAIVDLMAAGRLDVSDLVTHRFPIESAADAYQTLTESNEHALGIILTYPEQPDRSISLSNAQPAQRPAQAGRPRIGLIGVGSFASGVIVPALRKIGVGHLTHVASTSGVSAARFAAQHGATTASSDALAVIHDPEVDLVIVATRHSSHAELTATALHSGKDVYCEKPLAISWEGLAAVEEALAATQSRLYVGFNRRHSPMLRKAQQALAGTGPITIQYRINAGRIPTGHWYHDPLEGGRLLGEVCHFIDTCAFLVDDQPVIGVYCAPTAGQSHNNYHLLLGYQDGSSASIVYTGDSYPKLSKERIEVNGRGHTLIVDNFRHLAIDGKRVRVSAGKGHREGITEFLSGSDSISSSLQTTRTALHAAGL